MPETLLEKLQAGLKQLNVPLSLEYQKQALNFLGFVQEWNRHYNLTAIRDLDKMLTHHLLDSLSIVPFVQNSQHVLDIGSGAGFPGIPLALCFPNKQFVLLDSNGKKTRFLVQAIANLGIKNAKVAQSRVEDYESSSCFDTITCRAVGTVQDMLKESRHLFCPDGRLLMMKGTYPSDELDELQAKITVHSLNVPGLDAQRHLIVIEGAERG